MARPLGGNNTTFTNPRYNKTTTRRQMTVYELVSVTNRGEGVRMTNKSGQWIDVPEAQIEQLVSWLSWRRIEP